MSNGNKSLAPTIFRKLAGTSALVCFVLAVWFGVARAEEGVLAPGLCLIVGFMMGVIAITGYLPPPHPK